MSGQIDIKTWFAIYILTNEYKQTNCFRTWTTS